MANDVLELNPDAIVIKSSLKTGEGLDEIIQSIQKFMDEA
jgi:hydrogenase nickel incorporation protein HypB